MRGYINFFYLSLLVTSCLFFPGCGFAQNLSEDLKAMNDFYMNQESFKSDIRVEVFSGNDDASKIMVKNVVIRKKDKRFYYKIDDTEMLMTDKVLIMVDNNSKEVLYRKLEKNEFETAQRGYYTAQLDSAILKFDSVSYHGINNGRKHYTVYSAKKMIKRTELYLNASNNTISNILYLYNQKFYKNIYKVEIVFKNADAVVFSDNLFSEENFIIKTGKAYLLSQKYSSYKLNIIKYED